MAGEIEPTEYLLFFKLPLICLVFTSVYVYDSIFVRVYFKIGLWVVVSVCK
jgi:hypothetical protein